MYWGLVYGSLTLLLVYATKGSKPHLIASIGLLMWMSLEKVIYKYGAIELGTIPITIIFMAYSLVGWRYLKQPLFGVLALIGWITIIWTVFYSGTDAYAFKEVKNALYSLGLASVWLSYSLRLRDSGSFWRVLVSWFTR